MSKATDDTVQSIEVCADMFSKLRVFIRDRRIHYLAQTSARVMRYGVETYWNKHYNLSAGQTRQLALFQGGGDMTLDWAKKRHKGMKVLEPSPNSQKFRSRNGKKRLVSFTFGRPTETQNFESSNIAVHSFPMNMYERDVMLGGWAKKVMKNPLRKGTHIIKRYLTPKAGSELQSTTAPMLRDITERWREMGGAT